MIFTINYNPLHNHLTIKKKISKKYKSQPSAYPTQPPSRVKIKQPFFSLHDHARASLEPKREREKEGEKSIKYTEVINSRGYRALRIRGSPRRKSFAAIIIAVESHISASAFIDDTRYTHTAAYTSMAQIPIVSPYF